MMGLNYKIIYKKGVDNKVVDPYQEYPQPQLMNYL